MGKTDKVAYQFLKGEITTLRADNIRLQEEIKTVRLVNNTPRTRLQEARGLLNRGLLDTRNDPVVTRWDDDVRAWLAEARNHAVCVWITDAERDDEDEARCPVLYGSEADCGAVAKILSDARGRDAELAVAKARVKDAEGIIQAQDDRIKDYQDACSQKQEIINSHAAVEAHYRDDIAGRDTVILRLESELAAKHEQWVLDRDGWGLIHTEKNDSIAALERELAEAKRLIAEIHEPLFDHIGATDPHELKIRLVERDKWVAEAKEDSARWATAHVELCAAIARMPQEIECPNHRGYNPTVIDTDASHRQPLIDLYYKQRAAIYAAGEE